MTYFKYFFTFISTVFLLASCSFKQKKSDIELSFTQDTLALGYTYWWSEKTPFNANCTSQHSLIFTGKIATIAAPSDTSGPLYTAQEGLIEIEQLYKIKDLGKNIYAEQKFIKTDCFFESNLKVGDTVLVFCYDYENDYSIPGNECIIKIEGFDDPVIKSVRNYIDANDNPMAIKKDLKLWAKHNLAEALKANIECAQEMEKMYP